MKELTITGEDSSIDFLKSQINQRYPNLKCWVKDVSIKKVDLKKGFKDSFKNVADAMKKTMEPIDKVMIDIDKNIGNF